MIWKRMWARRDDEQHLDNRVLTALIRNAGWEFEPAQRVVNFLAAHRLAQPLHRGMVEVAVADELGNELGGTPPRESVSWAVSAVEQALHREGSGPR